MKASIKWVGEELFMGTSDSGHTIVLDAKGGSLAPSPLENILISLGACSSVDVVSILKKTRQNVTGCKVDISATRAESVPKLFSDIHLHFIISGSDIAE
jgi:putative redox protein